MLIAQITDTHIVEQNQHWLSEPLTATSERLAQVVSYLNKLNPRPDVVLLTGDSSDTGTKESYDHLKELLRPLRTPLYVIPGNHDCREEMRKAFAQQPYIPSEGFIHYVIDDYPVRLIGLDTHMPGKTLGCLCEERLAWLKHILKSREEKPTLLFMHHPPAKTGRKLFDTINCSVPAFFEELISSQQKIIGIITGHYHHFCSTSYGNKPCFIAPSVAPVHYFARPQDEHVTALELEDPAISLHQWEGGNVLISHIVRLKKQNTRIDWSLIMSRLKKTI